MPLINGTNGNDTLIGTDGDDIINPLLGRDTVDGGAGSDTFNIDYTLASTGNGPTYVDQTISDTFDGYTGEIKSSGGNDSVAFQHIEHLNYTGDAGASRVIVYYPGANGHTLNIDAGGGNDQLILATLDGVTFTRTGNSATSSGNATFANFESYRIDTTGGTNILTFDSGQNRVNTQTGGVNIITGGSGADSVASNVWGSGFIGAIDTFDGGGGLDEWNGRYGRTTGNLTFNYNGSDGSLSNGTSIQNVERVFLETGSGNDTFTVQAAPTSFNLFGGAGYDTVAVDFSAQSQGFELVTGGGSGTTSGNVLDGFESVSITAGSGNDRIGGLFSTTNSLDGRGGFDTAVVDASDQLTGSFGGGIGAGVIYDATTGKSLSLANIEALEFTGNAGVASQYLGITGGNGNDRLVGLVGNDFFFGEGGDDYIDGGAGDDILQGGYGRNTILGGSGDDRLTSYGIDLVDGGAGSDTWSTAYYDTTADLSVNVTGTSASLSNGSRASNIEVFAIGTGLGDDTYNTDARASYQQLLGREGFDTLVMSAAGTIGYSGVLVEDQGGFVTHLIGPQREFHAYEFENVSLSLGDGDNILSVDTPASSMVPGALLNVDGGTGNDKIVLGGLHTGYSFTDLGLGLQRITDTDPSDGTQLSFTFRNFENFEYGDGVFAAPVATLGASYTGTALADVLTGSAYNDTLTGFAGSDLINAGAGNDLLNGGTGDDRLDGGTGIDTASYATALKGVTVNLALTALQNTVGDGRDTLISIENLIGSNFVDTLRGNDAANLLDGGLGNDKLFGFGGSDTLIGGEGNDTLDGGTGLDTLAGGAGNDTYVVDDTGDVIVELAGGGTDTVRSTASFTLSDNIEKLTLTDASDIDGTGNALGNAIVGNAGNNVLSGGAGRDNLNGGAGNDTLIGGLGADTLIGGAGGDTFVFDVLETAANRDTINGFASGTDKIAISKAVFATFVDDPLGTIAASAFRVGTAATTVDQHIIYNAATGALFYDVDGVGGVEQLQIATLAAHPALVAGDLMLIG